MTGPVRGAAVDCGTNSIRLLIGEVDPAYGRITDLERRMEIVRLGQGVDRTGRIAPDALQRTLAACTEYAAAVRRHGVPTDRIRFVATSASRDAENRDDFVRGVREVLGVLPEVITGEEEAELSFVGATGELAGRPGFTPPYLVLDIGGGSTEFVLGDVEVPSDEVRGNVRASRSVDMGCVRLTERHLLRNGHLADPPSPEQIASMTADIEAGLDLAAERVPLTETHTLVGLAGSVTTVAAIALDLPGYDSEAIHHSRIPVERVREITERLLTATHAERAAIPVIHPGRVDVIGAGALVLLRAMERTGAPEVVVSEHDILDGILLSAVRTS